MFKSIRLYSIRFNSDSDVYVFVGFIYPLTRKQTADTD